MARYPTFRYPGAVGGQAEVESIVFLLLHILLHILLHVSVLLVQNYLWLMLQCKMSEMRQQVSLV